MKKWYFLVFIINLSKILKYFSLVIFIISLFNYFFGSPILLDSIDNNVIDNIIDNKEDNLKENNYNENSNPTNKNTAHKVKMWLYWRLFANRSDKYQSYDQYQKAWTSEFSFRKMIKVEFKKFKNNPIEYIKEDRNNFKNRILEDNDKFKINKSTQYVQDYGWLRETKIDALRKKGYVIRNSEITKVKK